MSARALATHHGFLATSSAVNNPPMTASLPSAVRVARAAVFAVVDNVAVVAPPVGHEGAQRLQLLGAPSKPIHRRIRVAGTDDPFPPAPTVCFSDKNPSANTTAGSSPSSTIRSRTNDHCRNRPSSSSRRERRRGWHPWRSRRFRRPFRNRRQPPLRRREPPVRGSMRPPQTGRPTRRSCRLSPAPR